MDANLALICGLTFVIHLIGTLAYAARIAGVRTGHIAAALTLFNLLVLVSRTSNAVQSPFLAKRIDLAIKASIPPQTADFHWILGSAALATLVGFVLVPTSQRIFTRAVAVLQVRRSLLRVLLHAMHPQRLLLARRYIALPRVSNLRYLNDHGGLSWWFLGLNAVSVALWTVGGFAALYAGALEPSFRGTCGQLSAVINGVATVLMFLLLDPKLSLLTDDVAHQRVGQGRFRAAVISVVGARFVGVLLAQVLLVPAAILVVAVARRI
ncbi:MAG: Lipid flippase Amj [Verrucomicrobiales bacterium]|nr:Lipid flippase Amj [Verrucomicrobiales bacterium]